MASQIPNNPPPTAPELNGNQNVNQNQQNHSHDTARKIALIAAVAIGAVALSALVSGMAAVAFAEGLVLTVLVGLAVTAVVSAAVFSSGASFDVYSYPTPYYYHRWRPIYTPPVVINSYRPPTAYRAPFLGPRTVPPVRFGGAPIRTAPSMGPRVAVGGGHFQAPARPMAFGGARVPVGGRRF